MRPELRIEEEAEPRIEERVALAQDEAGRRLLKKVTLQIERAAEAPAHIVVKSAESENLIDAIEKILRAGPRHGADHEGEGEHDAKKFHAVSRESRAGCSAARKRTSNSVHFSLEETKRSSPPWSRVNSRARFNPRPCPGIFSPMEPRKKRLKICSCILVAIGRPEFPTVNKIHPLSARALMWIRPRGWLYLRAFSRRFCRMSEV